MPLNQQHSEERIRQGIATIRAHVRNQQTHLQQVEQTARDTITHLRQPIPETSLIQSIQETAQTSDYLASYMVEKLRTEGVVRKDWTTGIIHPT